MMHLLVTAGPTREAIDPVRFISNRSSGVTGYEIAASAVARGHRVTLVSGPVALPAPRGVKLIRVVSADDMYRACMNAFAEVDVTIMTAAVCDYRPKRASLHKIKKTRPVMTLELVRTRDILAELGRRKRPGQILIGFALEDRRGRTAAKAKFTTKNLDAVILNSPAALGAERNKVSIYYDSAWHDWPETSKRALGRRILRLAERLWGAG